MRWDALFADLAAEFEAELETDRRAEVAERSRAEIGRLRLVDRLAPQSGSLRLGVSGHEAMTGRIAALGADWLLLTRSGGGSVLIPLVAVQWVDGLTGVSSEPGWEGVVGARYSVRLALRRIVRDRALVSVGLVGGEVFGGRLARVGADHVELTNADRRPESGAARPPGPRTFPIAAIAFVRQS